MLDQFFRHLADQLRHQLEQGAFVLPIGFDLGATFLLAMTGALAAMRRGYDWVGLFGLALATGLGGGLMRDGIFIQAGPPAMVADGRYLVAVTLACVAAVILTSYVERLHRAIELIDAVGLGAYGAWGVQKALTAGLSLPAVILVGMVNACGGGVLRDIMVREEPLVLKPGQFYAVAALLGCVLFVGLIACGLAAAYAALIAVVVTFTFRMMAIVFQWRTGPVRPWFGHGKQGDPER